MRTGREMQDWALALAPHMRCAKCGGPVERLTLCQNPVLRYWSFEFSCHGRVELISIPYELVEFGELRSHTAFRRGRPRKQTSPDMAHDRTGIASTAPQTPQEAMEAGR